ncbi:hypothetical protein V9T40_006351 [Parthenolecanium corni]|uniref:Uncharacterized protein n=1 Tax=Parthenolecanium corni TaxID=536013 RepID=A0AAN9Y7K0_9HEMI
MYLLTLIPKEKNQGKEKAKAVEEPREEKSSEEGEQNSGAESVDEKETGEGSGFEDSEEAPPKKKKKTLQ